MSLFNKSLNDISLDDIKALMGEVLVREDQQIEYKEEMISADAICAAMTSFANTRGGDLILGIKEKEGAPTAIPGIQISDIDKEKLRLSNIFQNGIEPRLTEPDIAFINVGPHTFVIIIRVRSSWIRPHRVKSSGKFYARKSNGKFPLDVHEIRRMFMETGEFSDRYSRFHEERVLRFISHFGNSPFTLLHIVPVSSFESGSRIDLQGIFNRVNSTPISTSINARRINLLGVYSESNDKSCMFQLFRNGIIEHATDRLCHDNKIPDRSLYDALKRTVSLSMQNYRSLHIFEPIYIIISIYGIKGYLPTVSEHELFQSDLDNDLIPFEFDKLIFPEIFIEDINTSEIPKLLQPIMDTLWNAFGFSKYSHELE